MEPSSNQGKSQGTFKSVSEVSSQIEFLRSSIQECALAYPRGDNGAINSGDQLNNPYPLMPNSGYFDTYCGAGESKADPLARDLRCPGNPGDDACHQPVFGGGSNKFMPRPPDLFSDWRYYNGVDGVFIWIQTDKTDAFLDNALDKMDASYSTCEADKIDAAGGSYIMASDNASAVCSSGGKCIRIWLKLNSTTGAPQFQEAGCP